MNRSTYLQDLDTWRRIIKDGVPRIISVCLPTVSLYKTPNMHSDTHTYDENRIWSTHERTLSVRSHLHSQNQLRPIVPYDLCSDSTLLRRLKMTCVLGGIWEQSMHAGNEEYLEEFLYNFVYLFFPLFLICSLEEKSKKLDYQSIMNQWVGVVSTNWISHVPTYSPSFIQPCLCSTNFIQNHRGITKFNKSLLGIFVRYKEKSWQ